MPSYLRFACALPLLWTPIANAQSVEPGEKSAIRLQPFPPTQWSPGSKVDVTTVHNYFGKCGSAVVQVLGVEQDDGDVYSVDAASDYARVVVLGDAGRKLDLRDAISDYNGVACLADGKKPYLLLWSNCGGTACGDDFTFTVVDIEAFKTVSGPGTCDARCAQRLTGSRLPIELNARR